MDADAQKMLGLLIGMSGGNTQEWADTVERSGQSEMVHSEMLPKDTGWGKTDLEPYKQMGITFGKEIDGIFIEATLPPNWKKVRTDHYMWSKVVDSKGRERISIFFKPEFYDRSANMFLRARYGVQAHFTEDGNSQTYCIQDGEKDIHTIGAATGRKDATEAFYDECDRLNSEATTWLNEHFPDWKNPLAYWD